MPEGINEESRAIERYLRKAVVGSKPWPSEPFGKAVYHYDVINSTQVKAKQLALAGEPEGTLVVARWQTAGYGRKGDFWHSGEGGLWFSLVLRPCFGSGQTPDLSQTVARVVAETLAKHLPACSFEVKTPNDVLAKLPAGSKKVCGIILEGKLRGGCYEWLILGVGLNVNNKLPPELCKTAATLEQISGRPVARMPLLRMLLIELAQSYRSQGGA